MLSFTDHVLNSCIVEMVYVVKVVNIVGSLYSTMPAPQRVALDLDSEKFQS